MEKKELWYEMLTTYCRSMHYENGITLPNMIGAYYYYDNTIDLSSSQCIVSMLNEIINSQKDMGVLINRCSAIENYVLSLFKEKHSGNPNLKDKIFLNLYRSEIHSHLSSVDELGEYLYSLHHEEIMNKRFSFTNKIWTSFSDIEMKHIHNIIESL